MTVRGLVKVPAVPGSPDQTGYKNIYIVKGYSDWLNPPRNGTTWKPWWITTAQSYQNFKDGDKVYFHESDDYMGKWTNTSKKNYFNNNPVKVNFIGHKNFLDPNMVYVDGAFRMNTDRSRVINFIFNNDAYLQRDENGPYNSIGCYSASLSKFQDCVISNCDNGYYNANEYSGIVIDGCILYFNGYNGVDRPHGHGIYSQGASMYHYLTNPTIIRNCIVFNNAYYGIQGYVGSMGVYGLRVENCISFNTSTLFPISPRRANILFWGPLYNCVMDNNCTYQEDVWHYPNNFGESTSVTNGIVTNNYCPDGLYISPGTFIAEHGNRTSPPDPPVNFIKVYDVRGRAHVAVYNWELLDDVTIDLSRVAGMYPGGTVEIINVQDLWVDRVTAVIDENRCVSVSMDPNDHSVQVPQGYNILTPNTTFPEFGCFVIRHL